MTICSSNRQFGQLINHSKTIYTHCVYRLETEDRWLTVRHASNVPRVAPANTSPQWCL